MKRRSFFSILFTIIGLVAAGWISYYAFKENRRSRQIENEIETLRQEAEKLRQNNQDISEKIGYFDTPEFQEKTAKEKLNLQKENENVAIIKPSPALRDTSSGTGSDVSQKEISAPEAPNYQKWWNYFFKY
jgi:cell division protein FtsB